ncbi:MAG TPA: VWA domain-containing protein [Vicinamibacterales bacterium]|nr:VWA domain-containing protein [Vicinamibacterales bacterium]
MRSPAPVVPGLASRLAAALALAVLIAGGLFAQQTAPPPAAPTPAQPQDQQPQPPRIKTGINFVRVDVIITDRQGKPVLDLKQDEFRLKEDGRAQAIESFSVVNIDEISTQIDAPPPPEIRSVFDEQREAARPDVRLFVLFLDDYHVRRGNDMVVRKPLIDFVENQLAPNDMVALMYPLTSINDLSFTRNRKSLVSAIEKFEGRRFNYQPRNEFEERYAYYPASTVERVRNEVVMSALKGAAIKMGGLREGRKSILFVSEGFTNALPPQLNDPIAAMPGLGNPNRGNSSAANSDRTEWLAQTDMISDLSRIFEEATRNNTSIYAIDPRGLAPFEYDINQGVGLQVDKKHLDLSLDNLRALAENTDGRAIINRNDLAAGMKQIIRDASGYYLLGYNSSQAPTDGKFHKIDVEVTRKGVEVRARKGYWAYTAEDAARATAPPKAEAPPAVANALASLAEPPRGRPARFWVGTTRGETGKSRVTFVWEPVPPAPGERRVGSTDAAAHVTLTALAPDGRPLFRGRVPDQPPPSVSTAATPGALPPQSTTFDVPPGQLQLRIAVQTADGQVLDSSTQELTVPDYTKVQVSFGTPRVYRVRTAREAQTVLANPEAVPSADRNFARTERLVVRADAYAPGGIAPEVTARLLNRGGTAMSNVPVQTSASGSAQMELPLANLAGGEYLLELNAKLEGSSAQEIVAFRIR